MSQHDMNIANNYGAEVRADINAALVALASMSSGATEPVVRFAGMLWLDTSVAPNGKLKQRNLANTGWIDPVMGMAWNGGTVTTNIKIQPVSGSAVLYLEKTASTDGNQIVGMDEAGLAVWRMYLGSGAADDFILNRYNDAGAFLSSPFVVSRASGLVTINNGLLLKGGLTIQSLIDMVNNKIVNLGAPTSANDASTKKYVDDSIAAVDAANIGDAPVDGKQYARKDAAWSEVEAAGSGGSWNGGTVTNPTTFAATVLVPEPLGPSQPTTKNYVDGLVAANGDVEEAPLDGTPYVRQDGSWVSDPSGGGGAWNGGTVTNPTNFTSTVVVPEPLGPSQAVTKSYVDGRVSPVQEAPNDGKQYARQNLDWSEVVSSGGGGSWDGGIVTNPTTFESTVEVPDPIAANQAASMGYVDAEIAGSGFVVDAASDGTIYGRRDATWVAVPTGGGSTGIEEAPEDASPYVRQDAAWIPLPTGGSGGIAEAPADSKYYVRQNATWQQGIPEVPVGPGTYARENGLWADIQSYIWDTDAPSDGQTYGRLSGVWAPVPTGFGDAPADGALYARRNNSWNVVPATYDWTNITGKPTSFPPTLPIAQSGITNLTTDLATKAALAGATFTGKVVSKGSAAAEAGFSLPHGAAPTTPINGDVWTTSAGLYARINGSTIGPFMSSGASAAATYIGDAPPVSPVAGQLWWESDSGKLYIYFTDANTSQWVEAALPPPTDFSTVLLKAGGSMTGKLNLPASTTTSAFLNLGQGAAPTTPVDGDLWATTGGALQWRHSSGNFTAVNTTGSQTISGTKTFSAKPIMNLSDASEASVNLPHGAAPTTPVDGDLWTTTAGIYARINGATVALDSGITDFVVKKYAAGTTSYVKPAGLIMLQVELFGAGGGGGGCAATTSGQTSCGGGGGGGGYARKLYRASDLAASESLVVGAGGAAGDGASVQPLSGGTSTFKGLSITGGGSGQNGSAGNTPGNQARGAGGVASGGDFNGHGNSGQPGYRNAFNYLGTVMVGGGGAGWGMSQQFFIPITTLQTPVNVPLGDNSGGIGTANSGPATARTIQVGSKGGDGYAIFTEYL